MPKRYWFRNTNKNGIGIRIVPVTWEGWVALPLGLGVALGPVPFEPSLWLMVLWPIVTLGGFLWLLRDHIEWN